MFILHFTSVDNFLIEKKTLLVQKSYIKDYILPTKGLQVTHCRAIWPLSTCYAMILKEFSLYKRGGSDPVGFGVKAMGTLGFRGPF